MRCFLYGFYSYDVILDKRFSAFGLFCGGMTKWEAVFVGPFCCQIVLPLDTFFFFATISALWSDSNLACCLLGLKAV